MKKLIYILTICGIFMSCGKYEGSYTYWEVNNSTGQELIFRFPDPDHFDGVSYAELPLSSARIRIYEKYDKEIGYSFPEYFNEVSAKYGEKAIWQILSSEGDVLKTWTYSERDLPDQRFFNKRQWYSGSYGNGTIGLFNFIFRVESEDIAQ